MINHTEPSKVLDGADVNQDIHQLIGYVFSLGNTEKVFPSSHLIELADFFIKKHRGSGEVKLRGSNDLPYIES